jgi:uncharacterized protein YdhG (YjbR/CyaY superfamily)
MTRDPRVDAYIANLPNDQRRVLGRLRTDVARLAPDAIETISYGMPAFKLDGHFLLSYAGWKRHCSVYPISDSLLARHAATVGAYGRTKGSLHFSEAQPLPDTLVRDLIEDRVAEVRATQA